MEEKWCRWCYRAPIIVTQTRGKTFKVACSKNCGYYAKLTADEFEEIYRDQE